MRHVLRIFWESVKDTWDELFILLLMNLVTVLAIVPVVTFPPALAGLWNVANRVSKGRSVSWSDYGEGFRRYFWKSWGLALVNILVGLLLYSNFRFYDPATIPFDISPLVSLWIRDLFLVIGLLWIVAQMYPLALLVEQEDQRLRVAFRNMAVLSITSPGFTILLALLLLVFIVVSTAVPMLWFLISVALIAVVCNKAVVHLLEPFREKLREEEQAAESSTLEDSTT